MNFENRRSAFDIGKSNIDLTIEAAWPQKGGIEYVTSVCACQDDHVRTDGVESYSADKKLTRDVQIKLMARIPAITLYISWQFLSDFETWQGRSRPVH